jgi:hypothetical protein
VNLQKVDASQNANLRLIDDYAFAGDEKLNQISFSPDVKNEVITVGSYPFQGTAFETMGDSSKQFDLTAAKFDATAGHSFSEMPKLRTVDIPENFSKNAIPVATFHNDTELEEVTVDWHIEQIDDAAFSNDNKLARIFIWGNTVVEDSRLEGYTAPERVSAFGRGGGDEDDDATAEGEGYGYTIPEGADIYAYSSNVTEAYAGNDTRKEFEGVFYPLDEVIYLTSNKPRVKIDNENNDFDKSDVVVYGLRRDGVVLESDNWGEFDGVAYPRSESDLSFERMAGVIEEKPEFGTVWDTPVPVNMLSLANENFRNIGFELVRDDENPDSDVRLINVIYTDAYTQGEPDTDIDPYADSIPDVIEEIIETIVTPFTGDRVIYSVILLVVSVLGFALIMKKRKKYTR